MHLVSIQYFITMDHVSEPISNTWVQVIDPSMPDQYQNVLQRQIWYLDEEYCNDNVLSEVYKRHVQPVVTGLRADSLEDLRNALDKLCAAHKVCWNERHLTNLIRDFTSDVDERRLEIGDAWFLDA